MKVALLNDKLDAGGAEKVLVNMANMLYQQGIKVSVILLLQPAALDSLLHKDIPVYYLRRKGRFDLGAMISLKSLLRNVDILHVHSRYNLRYFIVAQLLTGMGKKKVVFHEHIPVLSVDLFTKFCLRRVHAYVAVVQSMCVWAKNSLRLKDSRIFYLPNTINAPENNIKQLGTGYRILMVGNIWHFKNQLFAVDLLSALPASFTLDIYGKVNDPSYYAQLRDKIALHHLGNRINIVEGVSDIYTVLGRYNFAIHTSPRETGPLVLLEYMYAGLPFLSYKTGDVVTNVQHEIPESVIDSFDINTWKMAVENTMMNESVRLALRAKMKSIISTNYSEDQYRDRLQTIYRKVLN